MSIRAQVVDEARRWLDVRWRHQGRDRAHGIDCAGLVLVVGWRFGLLHGDTTGYQRGVAGGKFVDAFAKAGMVRKDMEEMLYGDVLALSEGEGSYSCHIALFVRDTIIHAHLRHRKVVEEPYSDDWRSKTLACYAYPGID